MAVHGAQTAEDLIAPLERRPVRVIKAVVFKQAGTPQPFLAKNPESVGHIFELSSHAQTRTICKELTMESCVIM